MPTDPAALLAPLGLARWTSQRVSDMSATQMFHTSHQFWTKRLPVGQNYRGVVEFGTTNHFHGRMRWHLHSVADSVSASGCPRLTGLVRL